MKNIQEIEKQYIIKIPDSRIMSWNIQIEMWKVFDEICRRHNLKYYIMFGALLGAVRHKGFIPWDDDIDVVMMREDYDRLTQYVDEFSFPYFLQTPGNSGSSDYSNLLLIDERTSCIDKKIISNEQRQGMKLDIVPLDLLPENRIIFTIKKIIFTLIRSTVYVSVCDSKKFKFMGRVMSCISKVLYHIVDRKKMPFVLEKYRKSLTKKNSEIIGEIGHGFRFRKKDFDKIVFLDFEEYKMPAPIGYQNILSELYGDYMLPPKIDNRQQSAYENENYFSSPYVSYRDYTKNGDKHEKR